MNKPSKKLSGNGRWESSRMMLPEHREQYLARVREKEAQALGTGNCNDDGDHNGNGNRNDNGKHNGNGRGNNGNVDVPGRTPTKEELLYIRDYVLLPIILTILERNQQQIQHSASVLQRLFVRAAEVVIAYVQADLYEVKRRLRQHNIQVMQEEHSGNAVQYRFRCRGYEERFTMMRDVMRAEVSVRLGQYVSRAAGVLSEAGNNAKGKRS